jgi:DNA-binding CsgD family transcriptional regulator
VRQGHHLLAALTASVAMRWGRARDVADVLAAAAAPGTSVLCELLAQAASASARGDLGRCVALAPRLRHAGMVALALRLAEDATTRTSVPAIRARARVVVAELKAAGTTDPLRTAETDDGNLTAREWQVARAAADRLRSREIADALGLSVRTVDNHLASAYRKLGVSGRDELARMLGTTGD